MAEKDGRENLGDDLGQQHHQFLLELFSELQDKVPSPGIMFAQMTQSNDKISDNNTYTIFCFFYSQYRRHLIQGEEEVMITGRPRSAIYTTYLGRLQKPHFSRLFLPRTVEDHSHQEDAQ